MPELSPLLGFSNIIRVIAIALAIYDLVQIISIYFMFSRRTTLDRESGLLTAHAQAVNSHILPTSIGVVGLLGYAVTDLFSLLGTPLSWKGISLLILLALLAYSFRQFCKAQTVLLAESTNWRNKMKEYDTK